MCSTRIERTGLADRAGIDTDTDTMVRLLMERVHVCVCVLGPPAFRGVLHHDVSRHSPRNPGLGLLCTDARTRTPVASGNSLCEQVTTTVTVAGAAGMPSHYIAPPGAPPELS